MDVILKVLSNDSNVVMTLTMLTSNTAEADTSEVDYKPHILQIIDIFIQSYITPILLLIGISGNTLSLVVFIRTRKRADASLQYLSSLAISDTGFIVFLGVADWITYGLGYVTNGAHSFNFYTYSNLSCKFMGFSTHTWEIASAWAIVAFTVERVYIVWYPLKRSTITVRKRAIIIVVIWIMALCLSLHKLVLNHVYIESSVDICWYYTNSFLKFMIYQYDTTVYNYIPCCLICASNVVILVGIRRAKRSFDSKMAVSRRETQDTRLILSLLLVSTLYVVLMTPASASLTFFFYIIETTENIDPRYVEVLFSVMTFLDQFSLLNYCLNFIIYGCTLPFYRKEVCRMFTSRASENQVTSLGKRTL